MVGTGETLSHAIAACRKGGARKIFAAVTHGLFLAGAEAVAALAYLFGIAFQYFPIRAMRNVSARKAIIDAVKADTLSLVAFEVGMFAWMAVVHYIVLPDHPRPNSVVFWFMMQIGMICGFITTCPANWLLIRLSTKSGM